MNQRRASPVIDVYAVLGVDRSIGWNDLRRSYRDRARELHPDVQAHRPGPHRLDQQQATALFAKLQAAWSQVSTPERRAAYDQTHSASLEQRPNPPKRPQRVPSWRTGPKAGVLLRTGPGDLHIAVPGASWDLSLKQFLVHFQRSRDRAILIGELPFDQPSRRALQEVRFCERHRLTTIVGLVEDAEERGHGSDIDEDGAWKLRQLAQAMEKWGRSFPARSREVPYSAELELMGRLSLGGFELNLPHPAGLFAAVESRPSSRDDAKRRSELPQLELQLPSLSLLLVASWTRDPKAARALERGWEGVALALGLGLTQAEALRRTLEGKKSRSDGYDPLPGSYLDRGPWTAPVLEALSSFPDLRQMLSGGARLPRLLPWDEPLSLCGEDRLLSDAAIRLVAPVVETLLAQSQLELIWVRGGRLRLRVCSGTVAEGRQLVSEKVSETLAAHLGFGVWPSVVAC